MATEETSTLESSQQTEAETQQRLALGVQWVFPETHGKRVTWLTGTAQVVGRDASCETTLSGEEVSRRHVELRRTGPMGVVRDLGSKNGVFVNAAPVSSAAFSEGDVLRVGDWVGIGIKATMDESLEIGELGSGLLGGIALRRVVAQARSAAGGSLPVVLVGETGTGKERLAQALHAWSGRTGPLLCVNCATYSEALAAAELFGHRKGAFTGAEGSGLGHIRAADGGTLFLDEVAELPASIQAQLLRVIEQGEVLPVGETKVARVNVRFVSAAQVPLECLVADKMFRADLRARLEGVRLTLPPLRLRRSDIPFLSERFLAQHAGGSPPSLDARLVEALCVRAWPLNVRELDLLMRRFLTLFPDEKTLKLTKVAAALDAPPLGPAKEEVKARRRRPADEAQRSALDAALERKNGNLTQAAAEIGITRAKAYRLLGTKKTAN
ncbi:MAG TPA: sigma 54-interacting transcriptional regulator [Polyangiaceae bacterium]|nr:sigma 54-interacting transcriptional regulator [Polyangiaceae bacterium]